MTLGTEQVADHIRTDGVVEWTTLANTLVGVSQSCVDGREPGSVLGTPGGDAGEYLLALAAIEKLTGNPISDDELPRVFQRFLGHFGRFYMHTDSHAMGHLAAALADTPEFAHLGGDVAATEALVRQPGKLADALMPHLLQPSNIGCGHIKLILLHSDDYNVRRGLGEAFLRTVFRALWSGADINYVVLQGSHAEGAVVQVTAGKDKHAFTSVPMVAPCHGDTQMFINHPQVVSWLRDQTAQFLVGEEPLLEGVDPKAFVAEVNALAGVQLGETLGHLAKGLPIYNARVSEDGSVEVSA